MRLGGRLRRRRMVGRHSATVRRARNMDRLLSLHLLCLLAAGVIADPAPAPGRVPKVYNALITSNQNLEPSKAYPVYQPVIHDTAFAYPFQPAVFYGDFPLSNGLVPPFAARPKQPSETPQPPSPPAEKPEEGKDTDRTPEAPAVPAAPPPSDGEKQATPAPPLPPNTQSPIPLNQFGLPPQVLPLGRFDPAFSGFTQVGPFTYSSFPGYRFYDPYDPFGFSPYANLPPVYQPLTNVLSQGPPLPSRSPVGPAPSAPSPSEQPAGGSPPEPNDLNVLNYSSKDPAIPNVPPPPLPSGGSKTDDSE